ncbi:hypothetical protein MHYP_G00157000 [Metynnis hypsauchen]
MFHAASINAVSEEASMEDELLDSLAAGGEARPLSLCSLHRHNKPKDAAQNETPAQGRELAGATLSSPLHSFQ